MISNILEQLVKLKTPTQDAPTRSRDLGVLSANKKKKKVVNEFYPNLMHLAPCFPNTSQKKNVPYSSSFGLLPKERSSVRGATI